MEDKKIVLKKLSPSAWVAGKVTESFTDAERPRGGSDTVQCR